MSPKSICILRLSAIGDCCHTLPVVRTLQAAYPDAQITWVIGTTEHSLLAGADGIEFITFDKNQGLAGLLALRTQLAGRQVELLLHMHASMRANLVSMVINARRRIGFDRVRARDYQWLFSTERIPARDKLHVLDGLFGFAEYLDVQERHMRWDIPVSGADQQFALSYFAFEDGTEFPVVMEVVNRLNERSVVCRKVVQDRGCRVVNNIVPLPVAEAFVGELRKQRVGGIA